MGTSAGMPAKLETVENGLFFLSHTHTSLKRGVNEKLPVNCISLPAKSGRRKMDLDGVMRAKIEERRRVR